MHGGQRMTDGKRSRTVRQLGGEIWIELRAIVPALEADWRTGSRIVELVMAVLARHAGATIENDADLPVEPLPAKPPSNR